VELYRLGKTPDSPTRALSGNPNSNHLVAKQEELGEGNDECDLGSIFVHTSK
jgi:hypothetical protein